MFFLFIFNYGFVLYKREIFGGVNILCCIWIGLYLSSIVIIFILIMSYFFGVMCWIYGELEVWN